MVEKNNKISFVARVVNVEGFEYKNLYLYAFDEKSRKYTRQGSGHASPSQRRINFSMVVSKFKNDDLVKITLKKQGKAK